MLENSAREPEVTDLIGMLRKMGACIEGDGTSTLHIRGVDRVSLEYRKWLSRIAEGDVP